MRLRDHRACGGGGCDECQWAGTEMVATFLPDAAQEMPSDAIAFEVEREKCPCYEGVRINSGVNQCMHPDADGELCEPQECPMVAPSRRTACLQSNC